MPRRGPDVLFVSGRPLIEEACRFSVLVLRHLDVGRQDAAGVTSAFTQDRDAAWLIST